MKKDINQLIARVKSVLRRHEIRPGAYARWGWNDENNSRDMGVNEYGCADAANILYTIGEFPKKPEERKNWIETLQGLQHADSGLFVEPTHHPIHTTAHCIAALELFDAEIKYELKALEKYKSKNALYELLEGLAWDSSPWNNSHIGAGIYAAMNLAKEASPEWNKWYFDWLWEEADAQTGLWRKGFVKEGNAPIFEHMASSFHYVFNHAYARMPLRYPQQMIDTCLAMYKRGDLPGYFGHTPGFLEIDWVYCITRALRQCGHRFDTCKAVLQEFADHYIDALLSLDPETDDTFNDLHMLFGSMCCVAELQQTLPGCIISDIPLKLVLDRRPFI